mmetsp:Transcript_20553/g.44500  ORF Transcript_20553/g.44500 Transcript_20553/m.44500 type:complete len:506 (-) Transcript_20553:148-1665(-)
MRCRKCLSGFVGGLGNFLGNFNLSVARCTGFHEFFDVFLLGSSGDIVGFSAMVRDIKTNFFFKSIDTEESGNIKDDEERSHQASDPANDEGKRRDLGKEKVPVVVTASPFVEETFLFGVVSGNGHQLSVGKETNGKNTPEAVGEVDRNGIDGIINSEADEELGESHVDPSTNGSNDNGGPGGDDRATSGHGDKSTEGTVHGHGQIVGSFSGLHGFEDGVGEHGGNTSSGSSHGSGDKAESSGLGRVFTGNGEGRTRVETVPADPEDEGTQNLEGGTVSGKGVGFFEGVAVLVVESSLTGSKNNGGDQSGATSSHVDNTRSGKIDGSDVLEEVIRVLVEGGEETVGTPNGVDDDWVDESSKEERVAEVGGHLATFGDGSGHNGGGGGRESELEEESSVGVKVTEGEVTVSNEGTASFVITTVGKTVTNGVETKRTTAGIQQVLQHNVLDVLLTDRTSTEHGETSLHEENHGTRENQEEGIKTGGDSVDGAAFGVVNIRGDHSKGAV